MSEQAPARLRRDWNAIIGDGVAFSIMVGLGETFLPAFVLAAGLSAVAAGWIATLPMLVGALFQLLTPFAVRELGLIAEKSEQLVFAALRVPVTEGDQFTGVSAVEEEIGEQVRFQRAAAQTD